MKLPFADESFDLVTAAFGFRNLANYEDGLREMMRVLKPGGTLGILEFTEPPDGCRRRFVPVVFSEGFAADWRDAFGGSVGLYVFAEVGGEIFSAGGVGGVDGGGGIYVP